MSTTARATRLRLAAWTIVVTAASTTWSSETAAHEVGTTAVTATLDGRRYAVELTLDPGALVAKLDVAAGRPRSGPRTPEDSRRTIERRAGEILQHVTILFDDRPVTATLESVSDVANSAAAQTDDSLTAPRVCLRVTGVVPRGARAFRWSYDLTFASYAFIVKRAGSPVGRVEWLEGGQSSSPFDMGTPILAWLDEETVVQFGRDALRWCPALMLGLFGLAIRTRLRRHIRIGLRSPARSPHPVGRYPSSRTSS